MGRPNWYWRFTFDDAVDVESVDAGVVDDDGSDQTFEHDATKINMQNCNKYVAKSDLLTVKI